MLLINIMYEEILKPPIYSVRQATLSDAPQIHDLLVLRSVPPGSVKPRELAELNLVIADENNYVCVVIDKAEKLCAVASLEVYEKSDSQNGLPGLAEVRSVAATVDGMGFGKKAALAVLEKVANLSIGSVYTTTDNLSYFNHLHFEERRGGNQILWMDFKKKPAISADLKGRVRPAKLEDKTSIYGIMQGSANFFPMGNKEFEHRYGSFWVFEDEKGVILGSVAPIVYANRIGGQPRMAEVRALSVDHNHVGQGVGATLLEKCWELFKDKNVIQALTTAYPGRVEQLLASGFFNFMPGNKSVLWWNGVIPNGIISNNIAAPFV